MGEKMKKKGGEAFQLAKCLLKQAFKKKWHPCHL
jgi:hypothetical protein